MAFEFQNLQLENRPLAILDLETTGVDPREDRIVEVAAIRFEPAGAATVFHRRVDPGVPIPAAATAVHGITDADVADLPYFCAFAPELVAFLEDCDLAGFGLKRFDLPLLCRELERAEVPFHLAGRRVLDVLEIYQRQEPRDLAAAVRWYCNAEHHDAHTALADAWATAQVLEAQLNRYQDLPRSVADLHAWASDVDIAGCFRRQGDQVVFAFGKYRGRQLEEVAAQDPAYLRWFLGQAFLDDARALVEAALARRQTQS